MSSKDEATNNRIDDAVKNSNEEKAIMRMNRRRFLQMAGAVAAAAALGRIGGIDLMPTASAVLPPYRSPSLTKFTQPMRGVYPLDLNGIPVAVDDGTMMNGAKHYVINISQYSDNLHTSLSDTTLRGYAPQNTLGGPVAQRHLGGIIIAQRGVPIQITFRNMLSGNHPIPIDRKVMGGDLGDNRADTHLHGGFVSWISDGGPHAWFDSKIAPTAVSLYGPSVSLDMYKNLNGGLVNGEAEYYYPMDQSARMLWYHDHTWGITRVNAYAGIATALILRDTFEADLINGTNVSNLNPSGLTGLPDYIENGGNEIPIVIQDKIFVDSTTIARDTTWTGPTTTGSLWYAHTYDMWTQGPATLTPLPEPSVIPEFFGDTMLVNGTVYPEQTVEARRYRLRILNACQARFLNLQLREENSASPGQASAIAGPNFLVLGTEGGFLPNAVDVPSGTPFNATTLGGSLITAPAERWDLIVDFSGKAGTNFILYNDAPAPFPMGTGDDFVGGSTGPDTRNIMRFKVVPKTGSDDPTLNIINNTDLTAGNDPLPVALGNTTPPGGIPVRILTLNEDFDEYGRLLQLLGTGTPPAVPGKFGRGYMDPITEAITLDATGMKNEIWKIVNLTGDTHPIHFHLVNVQIISRQAIDPALYTGGDPAPALLGTPSPPDANEQGWKETVRMNPNEVTTVYVPFKLPTPPPGVTIPTSPRTGGHEYVWHCHILEHEEHDMMRPLVILEQGQILISPPAPNIPEFPSIALPVAGAIAAMGIAQKLKDKENKEDKE